MIGFPKPNFRGLLESIDKRLSPFAQWLEQPLTRWAQSIVDGGATGTVPAGGATGEVLEKTSNADYDTEWATLPVTHSIPTDGATGQVLAKIDSTPYNVHWTTLVLTSTLAALTDVHLTSLANGDALIYDSGSGKWVNSAAFVGYFPIGWM
jgi:hypothetical protein